LFEHYSLKQVIKPSLENRYWKTQYFVLW